MKSFKTSMFVMCAILALPLYAAKKGTLTQYLSALKPEEKAYFDQEISKIKQINQEELSQFLEQVAAAETNANKTTATESPFSVRLNLNVYLRGAILIGGTIATLAILAQKL